MKICEKEIHEYYLALKQERKRLALQFFISKYLVLTGTKGGASKRIANTVWVSLLQRGITLGFFPLPKLWLKYMGCCLPEKENTKGGFFVFFFVFLKYRKRDWEVISSWLWFVRCSCEGFEHSGISRKHFSHSKTWMSLRSKLRPCTCFLKEIIFSTVGQKSWKDFHSQYV